MKFYNKFFTTMRESKQMTQEALAQKIGVTRQAVQAWEDGRSRPRPANVYAAAKELGIPVSDISDLNLRGEAEKKDVLLNDPFIQIILDAWEKISNEEKGRVAGIVRGMIENKTAEVRSASATATVKVAPAAESAELPASRVTKKEGPSIRCPHCNEYLYGSYVPGEKFSCPECGQHIVIHHIAKKDK